ncbi:MAG: 50S ribosomal protein L10 [Solirubrobacterales bacterium]
MDREQKEAAVAELTEGLKGAEAIFAVDYRGISVTDAAELRGKLREADAVFKVVKNRLAKRAAADAGTESIDELLVGPTALTLIHGDAVIAAKAIADFAREHDELEYKGGIMDGATLDPEGFNVIARLPGVDVLRGQLVGVAASPITGLVRGLGSMMSGLAVALGQIAEQGLVTGEAPAEEPAAEAEEPAPPAEHAEEEAQPTEEETVPADEPPADAEQAADADAPETSEDESEQDGEPSSDESEDTD